MTQGPEGASARRPVPGPSAVRSLIRRAGEAVGAARALLEGDERARQAVRDAYGALLDAGAARLERVHGVGRHSAAQAVAAAQRMAEAVGQDVRITADVDLGDEKVAALLAALHRVRTAQSAVERAREPARRIGGQFGRLMSAARPLSSRVRRALAGRQRREAARAAIAQLEEALTAPATGRDLKRIKAANERLRAAAARPATVRHDFERRAADYFAALERILGIGDEARPRAVSCLRT